MTTMSHEASNILRRFIRIATQLDPEQLGFLRKSARTLDSGDLRSLAREIESQPRDSTPVKIVGPLPVESVHGSDRELRGLARSIIRYGGADAVRQDAEPRLMERVNRIGWYS